MKVTLPKRKKSLRRVSQSYIPALKSVRSTHGVKNENSHNKLNLKHSKNHNLSANRSHEEYKKNTHLSNDTIEPNDSTDETYLNKNYLLKCKKRK